MECNNLSLVYKVNINHDFNSKDHMEPAIAVFSFEKVYPRLHENGHDISLK